MNQTRLAPGLMAYLRKIGLNLQQHTPHADWDRLEQLLIEAGVDPETLGFQLTDDEQDRLVSLAIQYQVPIDWITVVR